MIEPSSLEFKASEINTGEIAWLHIGQIEGGTIE
jgi:hypothetical protein